MDELFTGDIIHTINYLGAVSIAAKRSHTCPGHAERMAGHMARVAPYLAKVEREERKKKLKASK